MPVRAQAGVQVNPGNATRSAAVVAQHTAQRLVAPGRRVAAEEQAVRELMLATRDGGLVRRLAALGNVGVDGGHVVGRGRPFGRQQQRVQFTVGGIHRQRPAEVVKVAVQVHVLVGGAADVREAIGVERVDVDHRHTLVARLGTPFGVVQGKHLHTGAAVTFGAMAGAGDQQHGLRVGGAVAGHVHGKGFAVAPLQRVHMGLHRQTGRGRSLQELDSGFGVSGRKRLGDFHHAGSPASHSSARRTQ
jgi:hypothetical protein